MIYPEGGNENGEPDVEIFDSAAEEKIRNVFRDKSAEVYVIE